jgi:hypothetical protein
MFIEQEESEKRCDVVAIARGRGRYSQPYKRILKTFKLGDDFIALELARDESTEEGWWVSASIEATADKPAGYGAEYFEEYSDALDCFRNTAEKYGLEDHNGTDFGSD